MSLRNPWVFGTLILLLTFALYWWTRPNPRTAFINDIQAMITTVNEGNHVKMRKNFSPAFIEVIQSYGMTPEQALLTARRRDLDGNHQYRFLDNPVFEPKDYAEVELERSGVGGDFSTARAFGVPFIYVDGKWKVAGDFRGTRVWEEPY